MLDILIESLSNKYYYLQIVPAVIGLLFVSKIDTNYKFFVLLLWYGVLNEVFALYYGRHINNGINKVCYNLYNIIYFAFLFWLFYRKATSEILKKIILSIVVLYVLSILYEVFYIQLDYHMQPQVISYVVGSIGVFISVFYILLDSLLSNKPEKVYSNLLFWIAIAFFFYYLGFTPIKIGENYFDTFKEYNSFELKMIITFIKSFILSIGFICSRQRVQ